LGKRPEEMRGARKNIIMFKSEDENICIARLRGMF
jgi:hypothetical protein